MLNTVIHYKIKGKNKKFDLVHNLDEFGLTLDAAFINWSGRTSDYSVKSFIDYVVSKDPFNLICMTKKVYDSKYSK